MAAWLDYLKRFGSRRLEMKERIANAPPVMLSSNTTPFYAAESVINQLPIFTVWTGRVMLRSDPIINFALNVRNAALMVAEVEITAKNELVRAWVERQWNTLWSKHRNKLLSAKSMGYAALQLIYKEKDGLLEIEDVKDFAPEYSRALECGGHVAGFKLQNNRKVMLPEGLWLTFNSEYGNPYGTGCLRRQYPPWFEKWMDHGAQKLIQLRMLKDAYIGDIYWYPHNQVLEVPRSDGSVQRMPWRDLVREIGESRLSGSAQFLPMVKDDKGNKLLEYQPPQSIQGQTDIFTWKDNCDEQILRGADVPMEVIKAQENGGFSGRSIPFMVVLSVCSGELTETIQCVDVALRGAAWLNWGQDVEFEIKPKSLVESFAADAGGSPMGGGAIGGQPGQRPQQQIQQRQPQPQRATQFDEGGQSTDDIAEIGITSARSRIRGAASRIRALKKNELTPLGELADLITGEIYDLQRGISSDLSASMLAGQLTGMADAWTAMPAEAFEPPATLPGAPPLPPQPPPSIAEMFGPDEPPPRVSFPVLDDAIEVLKEAPAQALPDFRATAAAVKQGAFAITGDLTDAAVADVRDLLTENLQRGPDREAFIDAVIDRLGEGGPLSESHIEQIFRTNTASAISDGMSKSLDNPLVSDAFPYRAFFSTSDNRARATHRALEHLGLDNTNIYRSDDPTWTKFRPPFDFNCRCSWSPVSVEQASRRGVTEAQEWFERAKAMAEQLGGSAYQYFTRTEPASPQWVAPPDFNPSPEFVRT
jgi:SPP1 gp7 family putative phage head morphogenesis protein